jgi:hypothetical protein
MNSDCGSVQQQMKEETNVSVPLLIGTTPTTPLPGQGSPNKGFISTSPKYILNSDDTSHPDSTTQAYPDIAGRRRIEFSLHLRVCNKCIKFTSFRIFVSESTHYLCAS